MSLPLSSLARETLAVLNERGRIQKRKTVAQINARTQREAWVWVLPSGRRIGGTVTALVSRGLAVIEDDALVVTEDGAALARILAGGADLFCDAGQAVAPYPNAPRAFKASGRFRHLCGPDLRALRLYARAIGMELAWEQTWAAGGVHYDVTGRGLEILDADVRSGIVRELSRREFVAAVGTAAESQGPLADLRRRNEEGVRGAIVQDVQRQDYSLPYGEGGDLPALWEDDRGLGPAVDAGGRACQCEDHSGAEENAGGAEVAEAGEPGQREGEQAEATGQAGAGARVEGGGAARDAEAAHRGEDGEEAEA